MSFVRRMYILVTLCFANNCLTICAMSFLQILDYILIGSFGSWTKVYDRYLTLAISNWSPGMASTASIGS